MARDAKPALLGEVEACLAIVAHLAIQACRAAFPRKGQGGVVELRADAAVLDTGINDHPEPEVLRGQPGIVADLDESSNPAPVGDGNDALAVGANGQGTCLLMQHRGRGRAVSW